jgi:hypothetical protein
VHDDPTVVDAAEPALPLLPRSPPYRSGMSEPSTVSLAEAAALSGVSKPTVRARLARAGFDVTAYRQPDGSLAIPLADLDGAGLTLDKPTPKPSRSKGSEVETVLVVKLEAAEAIAALHRERADALAREVDRLGALVTWLTMELDRTRVRPALESGRRWFRKRTSEPVEVVQGIVDEDAL